MKTPKSPYGLVTTDTSLEMQFCFDGDLGTFLQNSLEQDIRNAKFSLAFRFFYALRNSIPTNMRRWTQSIRNRALKVPDQWYIPTDLEDALRTTNQADQSIWPNRKDFAFVLTHDVEEQSGFKYIFEVAQEEEKRGFRSCWNIVPYKYRVDLGVLRELQARGHEIAVHGYNHDGRLFLNKSIFDSRLAGINQAVEQFGAKGFRAPMVHRELNWMQSIDVEYDSSCFDIDPFQAMPGGVQSIWPFLVGNLVELPYTLPQDHTIFVTMKESSTRIWEDKLAFIRKYHGMALMLTHPDYLQNNNGLSKYCSFLDNVGSIGNFWHVLPYEMARWFRATFVQGDPRDT